MSSNYFSSFHTHGILNQTTPPPPLQKVNAREATMIKCQDSSLLGITVNSTRMQQQLKETYTKWNTPMALEISHANYLQTSPRTITMLYMLWVGRLASSDDP
jgi:hypothetical protein